MDTGEPDGFPILDAPSPVTRFPVAVPPLDTANPEELQVLRPGGPLRAEAAGLVPVDPGGVQTPVIPGGLLHLPAAAAFPVEMVPPATVVFPVRAEAAGLVPVDPGGVQTPVIPGGLLHLPAAAAFPVEMVPPATVVFPAAAVFPVAAVPPATVVFPVTTVLLAAVVLPAAVDIPPSAVVDAIKEEKIWILLRFF